LAPLAADSFVAARYSKRNQNLQYLVSNVDGYEEFVL
jgi:hypothetical protein